MNRSILLLVLVTVSLCYARVPPRNHHEVEEVTPESIGFKSPNFHSNLDSESNEEDKNDQSKNKVNRFPIDVLLFRLPLFLEPSFSKPEHNTFRLLSMLFGNRKPSLQIPNNQSENEDSSEIVPSSVLTRNGHPLERLFPNIFVGFPQFELPDSDKVDLKPDSEENGPNFEKKEKKVVTGSDGKKYVKTIHEKKMKNDFGNFHSVISSYVPYEENIHDENGEEKNPEGSSGKNLTDDKKEGPIEVKPELNGEKPKSNKGETLTNEEEIKFDKEKLDNVKKPKNIGKEVEDKPLIGRKTSEEKPKENKSMESNIPPFQTEKQINKKVNENEINDKNSEDKPEPIVVADN